jgi:DNA-binding response OmpR family regulator
MTLPDETVILLAEDLPDDVFLTRRAFDEASIKNRLLVVRDGEECLAYLYGQGEYSDRDAYPMPNILLLDLKMPKIDGFEVLREIRANKAFSALRVIVLTSSGEIRDVNKAYELGANSFLVKPLEFENLVAMMSALSDFWLGQNTTRPPELPALANEPASDPGGQGQSANN